MSLANYGWAVIDCNGKPWWDEMCVCEDRGPLADIVKELNEEGLHADPRAPYRVVRLYWNETKRRK